MPRHFLRVAFLIGTLGTVLPCYDSAVAQDGFDPVPQLKSRYFNIYLREGVDTDKLLMKIAVPPSAKAMVYSSTASFKSDRLEDQMDLLYLVVSEILEARMKEFTTSAKVCADAQGLGEVSTQLFGRDVKAGGFYIAPLDSLYIDSDNVTLYILGHELAHAVITKYFVVPPPERIQEVLAGYVEYELRKKAGDWKGR